MSLVLDLSDLGREVGESLEFELSSGGPRPLPAEGVEFGPVRVTGRALWTGETVLVESKAEVEACFTCSRCLEPFTSTVSAEFVQEFRPVDESGDPAGRPSQSRSREKDATAGLVRGGRGTSAEEPDAGTSGAEELPALTGEEIDLSGLVWEALALELPMKPVCSDECRGLCPVCGGNLNENDCGCRAEETDPRLLPLKKLLEAQERSE